MLIKIRNKEGPAGFWEESRVAFGRGGLEAALEAGFGAAHSQCTGRS